MREDMAKRTGEKYESIIDAAIRVIAEYGYHNAQVSKIAREANVADGTIYLYFKNKDDVLISLFTDKMGSFIKNVEKKLKETPDVSAQLKRLIHMHFAHLAENRELAIVTQIELRQSNPDVRRGIGELLKQYFNLIDNLIERGTEAGIFYRTIDVKVARKMIFGTLDESVTSWIMNGMKYDLLTLVEPIHQLLLNGFKVQK